MLGNEKLIEQLKNQAEAGSLSHAYLIVGERGMGKKELARRLCLEVFCTKKQNGSACGACPDCKKILSGNHPDVIWLVHEKPNLISVREIREQISDTAVIRPYEGRNKIYIIEEAQKMNVQAQNALLKTLEEPPEYVILLLLCDDEHALLDTIRSRCVKIKPERISSGLIREKLEKEGIDGDTALEAAEFAQGNPGRALELAGSEDFKKAYHLIVGLCRNIHSMNAAQIGQKAEELADGSVDPELILELLENWYRDLAYYRSTGQTDGLIFSGEQKALKTQAYSLPTEKISEMIRKLEDTATRFRANVNKELSFYMLLIGMRDL